MKGDSSPLGRGDAALSEDDFLDVMEGREGVADISFESTSLLALSSAYLRLRLRLNNRLRLCPGDPLVELDFPLLLLPSVSPTLSTVLSTARFKRLEPGDCCSVDVGCWSVDIPSDSGDVSTSWAATGTPWNLKAGWGSGTWWCISIVVQED